MAEKSNNTQQIRLEIIFDERNSVMKLYRNVTSKMYYVIIGLILVQFVLLISRQVGMQPVWVLIEYLQLVAFMPIYNFRLFPYLYEAFKPALVSHLIIFDEKPYLPQLDKQFFNKNYAFYKLSVGRLAQAAVGIALVFSAVVIANLVVFLITKCIRNSDPTTGSGEIKMWADKTLI